MKALVVYYSNKGRSRYLAQRISESLACDLEEIRPRLNAFILFLMSINLGIKPLKNNIKEYENVILCGPIWMGRLIPPLRDFLLRYGDCIQKLAVINCCGISDTIMDQKFGNGFVYKEITEIVRDKCALYQAFPVDLAHPDDNFTSVYQERLDTFIAQISYI